MHNMTQHLRGTVQGGKVCANVKLEGELWRFTLESLISGSLSRSAAIYSVVKMFNVRQEAK
jgi:hypothetical protein